MSHADFKKWRNELGLSRRELAIVLGVSTRSVEYWESEISPKPWSPQVSRLITAYRDGYRPKDWPIHSQAQLNTTRD